MVTFKTKKGGGKNKSPGANDPTSRGYVDQAGELPDLKKRGTLVSPFDPSEKTTWKARRATEEDQLKRGIYPDAIEEEDIGARTRTGYVDQEMADAGQFTYEDLQRDIDSVQSEIIRLLNEAAVGDVEHGTNSFDEFAKMLKEQMSPTYAKKGEEVSGSELLEEIMDRITDDFQHTTPEKTWQIVRALEKSLISVGLITPEKPKDFNGAMFSFKLDTFFADSFVSYMSVQGLLTKEDLKNIGETIFATHAMKAVGRKIDDYLEVVLAPMKNQFSYNSALFVRFIQMLQAVKNFATESIQRISSQSINQIKELRMTVESSKESKSMNVNEIIASGERILNSIRSIMEQILMIVDSSLMELNIQAKGGNISNFKINKDLVIKLYDVTRLIDEEMIELRVEDFIKKVYRTDVISAGAKSRSMRHRPEGQALPLREGIESGTLSGGTSFTNSLAILKRIRGEINSFINEFTFSSVAPVNIPKGVSELVNRRGEGKLSEGLSRKGSQSPPFEYEFVNVSKEMTKHVFKLADWITDDLKSIGCDNDMISDIRGIATNVIFDRADLDDSIINAVENKFTLMWDGITKRSGNTWAGMS